MLDTQMVLRILKCNNASNYGPEYEYVLKFLERIMDVQFILVNPKQMVPI